MGSLRRFIAVLAAFLLALPVHAADPLDALADVGHWKRVRVAAEQRLKANPNDAHANYLMARVKEAYADPEGALPFAEKAVALDAQNSMYHLQLGNTYGQMAQRASIFKQLGLAGKFKGEVQKAIELDPKNIDALWSQMEFYLQAPGIAGGDKKKARANADRIFAINPSRGNLAYARLALKEDPKASVENYSVNAVQADPRSYAARLALAGFYAGDAQKKYDLAERYSREALKLEPGRAGAYSLLVQVLVLQDRWPELDAVLLDAEKNVPDNLNPYYQAGRVLLQQGKDFPRAERYFRKYLTQEPEGRAPSLAAAHWRLGQVLEKLGRKQEAIAELQLAAQLEPKNENIRKDLKRLKS